MLEYILSHYMYQPDTGRITNYRGKVVGCYTKEYPELFIQGKTFRIHQLAFILMHGGYPEKGYEIDHINHDPHDNRWINLRLVTKGVNITNQNRKFNHGVYFEKSTQKWVAQLRVNHKTYKRRFNTVEAALAFRTELELTYLKGN